MMFYMVGANITLAALPPVVGRVASINATAGAAETVYLELPESWAPNEVLPAKFNVPASKLSSLFQDSHRTTDEVASTLLYARSLANQRRPLDQLKKVKTSSKRWENRRIYEGVPDSARLVIIGEKTPLLQTDPSNTIILSGDTVFRHYTDEKNMETIARTQTLIPGPGPFASRRTIYRTLFGSFVAFPELDSFDVGVDFLSQRHYVDLRFPNGTGMIRLKGRKANGKQTHFFMVPGIPQPRRDYLCIFYSWLQIGRPTKEKCEQRTKGAQAAINEFLKDPSADIENLSSYGDEAYFSARLASLVSEFEILWSRGGWFQKSSQIPIEVVKMGENKNAEDFFRKKIRNRLKQQRV